MAATFNMLRGTDLIWNYVVNNYLLGEEYPAFDLLHWNGDVTNLPARWHKDYLEQLYRDNRLVEANSLEALGFGIDLGAFAAPAHPLACHRRTVGEPGERRLAAVDPCRDPTGQRLQSGTVGREGEAWRVVDCQGACAELAQVLRQLGRGTQLR